MAWWNGLRGAAEEFGDTAGRHDSGKATAADVAWAGGKFGLGLGGTALGAYSIGKLGIPATGRGAVVSSRTEGIHAGRGALASLMKDSAWHATQQGVSADKINRFAELMRAGKWRWDQMDQPIVMDAKGSITSGHHRLIASRIAGVPVPPSHITWRLDAVGKEWWIPWEDLVVR